MTIIFLVGLSLGGLVFWAGVKWGPGSRQRRRGRSSSSRYDGSGSGRSVASRAWSSSASRSTQSISSGKNMKRKTFQRKRGGSSGGKTKTAKAKRVKHHQTMTQKLARKKASEERFRNVRVGIRSAPSSRAARSSVPRSDPKSRPRVCTLERPGTSSSRNNKRPRPTTFYASPNSPRVDEAKRKLRVAEHRKPKPTDILPANDDDDAVSEDLPSIAEPSPTHKMKSAFSFKSSFGSNFSDFDTITAMRTKLSNFGSRIDDDGSESDDNNRSLRERYSRPEPVFSPTELRTPKPMPKPKLKQPPLSSSKLQRQPSTRSRQRARQCSVFDAMSGDEESRVSRESKVSRMTSKASWDTKAMQRHIFADAQIPELSEDDSVSSNFDTVYTEQSAMEDGRLPATALPLPLNHRRQVSFDAKIVLSPSTAEEKQTKSDGKCRCD